MFAWEIIDQAYAFLEDGDLDKAYNLFVRANDSNPTPADYWNIVRGLRETIRQSDGRLPWPPGV